LTYVAELAARVGWDGERDRLQRHWRSRHARWLTSDDAVLAPHAALALALWDERAGTASRLVLALEACEAFATAPLPAMERFVRRAAARPEEEVRERARALLDRWGAAPR
jgi:hypothetical protein